MIEDVNPDFDTMMTNPFALKHLCRAKIRGQLEHLQNINRLPLPQKMKTYLWFPELDTIDL